MPENFSNLVRRRLKALGWTSYRLAKTVEGEMTMPTVYRFLDGKPVTSDSLAAIFEAVGLVVVEQHEGGEVARTHSALKSKRLRRT